MSARLHEALAELAEEMPAARIDDDLWTRAARGKRRRRVASIGAAFAAVLIVVGGVTLLPGQFDGANSFQPAAPTQDGRGIPDRIHDPWPWTPTIDQYPAGAASVALQGPRVRDSLGGALDEGRLVVIGDGEDTYRNLAPFPPLPPGMLSMLSPDGTRLAYPSPEVTDALMVRDLRTGKARGYRAAGHGGVPAAGLVAGRPVARGLGVHGSGWGGPRRRGLPARRGHRSGHEAAGPRGGTDVRPGPGGRVVARRCAARCGARHPVLLGERGRQRQGRPPPARPHHAGRPGRVVAGWQVRAGAAAGVVRRSVPWQGARAHGGCGRWTSRPGRSASPGTPRRSRTRRCG